MAHRDSASTLTEVLVALLVLGIICFYLFLPALIAPGSLFRGQQTQTLSNMKQLHLATQVMAQDGQTNGVKGFGWPGDTGGSYYFWARNLVPEYLGTNDFCKLLSSPGKLVPPGKIPQSMREGAVLVYAVSTNSPDNAVFLTSGNFTNTPTGGLPLEKAAKPYGERGFVIFRKAGDGALLKPTQIGMTNAIGSFAPLLQ